MAEGQRPETNVDGSFFDKKNNIFNFNEIESSAPRLGLPPIRLARDRKILRMNVNLYSERKIMFHLGE